MAFARMLYDLILVNLIHYNFVKLEFSTRFGKSLFITSYSQRPIRVSIYEQEKNYSKWRNKICNENYRKAFRKGIAIRNWNDG